MPSRFGTMPDYGAKIADKAFDQSVRKIREVYRQAAVNLQDKLADFMNRHRAKGTEMLDKLKNGEITQAAYHAWMRGQVFTGKQWKDKVESAVKMLDTANKQCADIIQKEKLTVFAENYNHAAYELEKKVKGVVSFNIYNEKTAAQLIKTNPKMLPEWKIHERKDYAWSRQKVETAITQGIIQGEGIDQITDRMVNALCTGNENKMRTFARTAVTGAQNAGRQAQMDDAEEMGIEVKKKWIATLDNRTRDTHQELDGQTIGKDEPFTVQLDDGTEAEIMFPGDPSCKYPELIYNCRCSMIEVYEGIERRSVRRAYEDPDETGRRRSYTVENMTYKEWKAWKEGHR